MHSFGRDEKAASSNKEEVEKYVADLVTMLMLKVFFPNKCLTVMILAYFGKNANQTYITKEEIALAGNKPINVHN